MLSSISLRSSLALLVIALSAAMTHAAVINATVNETADNHYAYRWDITVPLDGWQTSLTSWSLPLVLGSPDAIDPLSIITPYDYWNADFVSALTTGWDYQPASDPHAATYADPADQFADPACVLLFTFDAATRNLRASQLPSLIDDKNLQLQIEMMQLQQYMSRLNQATEMLQAALIQQGTFPPFDGQPIDPAIQLLYDRVDQARLELTQAQDVFHAHQAELQALEDERDYALSGVNGIAPGTTAQFSLTSSLAPADGPACLDTDQYAPTQVPFAPTPVPEPAMLSLLALGSMTLLRRKSP